MGMELHIDLLRKREKSAIMIILGLLSLSFLVLILTWKPKMPSGHYAPILDGIFYIFLFAAGVGLTFTGFGISFANFFGKAFIIIDRDKILIKAKPYSKEQMVLWADIKAISYESFKYHIIKINENKQVIDCSKIDYSLLIEIKRIVNCIANEKGFVLAEI